MVTFVCAYSRYTVAVPIRESKAVDIADVLVNHWIAYFGIPLQILCDRAAVFEGSLWTELCKILHIHKLRTCVLTPSSNGQAERTQASLVNMLNCVCAANPFSWSRLIRLVSLAHNNMVNTSTKIEPSRLIFGRYLNLPPDLVAPTSSKNTEFENMDSPHQYVLRLQEVLRELNERCTKNAKEASFRISRYYDTKVRYNEFIPGQLVYYHYPVKTKNTSKSAYFPWKGPLVIIQRIGDCLYKIQESEKSKPFIVHHNKLKRCLTREPIDTSWIKDLEHKPPTQVEIHDSEPLDRERPRRLVNQPDRLGDWLYSF